MEELVSVIIPTYKGAKKIARAIESVLSSTYRNIEILIVDDNEPDSVERKQTEELVHKYIGKRVKYITHSNNKNGAAARNTGINHARGEYITFLDDDDYILPNRIEYAVNMLKMEERDTFFSGVCIVRSGVDCRIVHVPKVITPKTVLLNDKVIGTGSNLFIRSRIVNEIGGFDESFVRYQDREFLMRLCKVAKICVSDEVLVIKSKNGQNNIPDFYKMNEVEEKFIKKYQDDYDSLTIIEKEEYENKKNHMLLELAMNKNDKNAMSDVYCKLKENEDLLWYEIIAFWMMKKNIKNILKIKKIFAFIVCKIRNVSYEREVKDIPELWRYVKMMESDAYY